MTTKVNGHVLQGSWFERDTSILNVVASAGVFDAPTVQGPADAVMNVLQTRGTVIGYTVISATEANFMFGHAAGAWSPEITAPPSPPGAVQPDVLAELTLALGAIGAETYTLTVFEGFAGATPLATA